jgi:hypothetical protein
LREKGVAVVGLPLLKLGNELNGNVKIILQKCLIWQNIRLNFIAFTLNKFSKISILDDFNSA